MMGAGNWYTMSGTVWANVSSAYDFNVSMPQLKGAGWSVGLANLGSIPLVNPGDKLLLVQGTFGGHPMDYYATVCTDPANITAVNLQARPVRANTLVTNLSTSTRQQLANSSQTGIQSTVSLSSVIKKTWYTMGTA